MGLRGRALSGGTTVGHRWDMVLWGQRRGGRQVMKERESVMDEVWPRQGSEEHAGPVSPPPEQTQASRGHPREAASWVKALEGRG